MSGQETVKDSLFKALTSQAIQLHIRWNQYEELFDANDENIVLMNEVAPPFFRILQEALGHDIILGLARLTDRRSKDTVTIYRLPKEIQNEEMKNRIQKLIEENEPHFKFCKIWRDNHLAHANLEIHTQNGPFENFLPIADRESVANALKAITDILKACEKHFGCDSTDGFWDTREIKIFDGASKMIRVLSEGQRVMKEKSEKKKTARIVS